MKIFLCALIILMPQLAGAEKVDWKDNSYNFKTVRRVILFDLTASASLNNVGNAVIYKLKSDYLDRAQKSKCQIITESQAKSMLGVNSRESVMQNARTIADGWVTCNIKQWKSDYYIVPARTVWEDKRMTRRHELSDGSSWEETYYITVPVTYPPYRVDTSDIAVSFELVSATTGSAIFVRDDIRSREDEDAQKDMFRRICNSFFEDVGKAIK